MDLEGKKKKTPFWLKWIMVHGPFHKVEGDLVAFEEQVFLPSDLILWGFGSRTGKLSNFEL